MAKSKTPAEKAKAGGRYNGKGQDKVKGADPANWG
jgi:hypothetical protein